MTLYINERETLSLSLIYVRTHVDTHPTLFIRQELTNVMQDEQADISDPDAA